MSRILGAQSSFFVSFDDVYHRAASRPGNCRRRSPLHRLFMAHRRRTALGRKTRRRRLAQGMASVFLR